MNIQIKQQLNTTGNAPEIEQHQLYQKAMLQHHKSPVGFEKEITATNSAQGVNAACGDEIEVHAHVIEHQINSLAFHGDSCAICRASASMLCENLAGLSIDEAKKLSEKIITSVQDNVAFIGELADKFSPLMSVQKFPVRKQCALLPWQTILLALKD